VDRICPFLALDDDGRTAVAGYDPDHRCHAVRPKEQLHRQQQLTTCLAAEHQACPRYLAARANSRAAEDWPIGPAEAGVINTRLVLGPDAASRGGRAMSAARPAGRWAVGTALAVVGVAVAGGVTGAFGSFPPEDVGAAPSESASLAATATPTEQPPIGGPSPRPATSSPASPTADATPAATPTSEPTATPAPPQARTYVVQSGDTLSLIATRFGSSVTAIQQANGLADSDVILIGQVLAIP
jgi:LysM repeat protein